MVRAGRALIIIVLGSAIGIAAIVYAKETGGRVVCNDIAAFYVASKLMLQDGAGDVYRATDFFTALQEYCGNPIMIPYTYPPPYNLIVLPFAYFPMWLAYLLFTGATLTSFLLVVRLLARTTRGFFYACLFPLPGLITNAALGQNGFLLSTIIGAAALATLLKQPRLSGAWMGLICLKPHLGVGFSIFLLARMRRVELAFALLVTLLLSALAALIFGLSVYGEFIGSLRDATRFLVEGRYPLFRMTSAYAFAFTASGNATGAVVAHTINAGIAALLLVVVCRASLNLRTKLGVVIALSLGISPYLYEYDWCLFSVSLALLWRTIQTKASTIEKLLLAALTWIVTGYGASVIFFADDAGRRVHSDDVVAWAGLAQVLLYTLLLKIVFASKGERRRAPEVC